MKMKKLMTLGVIAPIFAMTTSCSQIGIRKVTFDEAFNFAIKHYDQYHHLGYEPTYILKLNNLTIGDMKGYKQVIKEDSRSFEQVYYVDTTVRDLATTIDTDEIPTLQINSIAIRKIADVLSIANALLGYFETSFTLENEKYLGIYIKSDKVDQIFNIVGGVAALGSLIDVDMLRMLVNYVEMLTADDSTLKLTASCNNLGLFDRAHLYFDIKNLSLMLGEKIPMSESFRIVTAKHLALDLDLIVDYSGK